MKVIVSLVLVALSEQLGLKLDPKRELVNVLVIDDVQRPVTD